MAIRFQATRPAELHSLAEFRDLIDQACSSLPGIEEDTRYDLKLAVDEACTNIILHGYKDKEAGSIILTIEIEPEKARVTIIDFGEAFEQVEDDLTEADLQEGKDLDGLGIFFIHQSTDRLEYESSPAGNRLILEKFLTKVK